MEENPTKKQIIAIASILGTILAVALIILTIQTLSRAGKVKITVKYAPFSAEVTLNGKKLKNNAQNYITPGEYQLTVTNPDFATQTDTVTIDDGTEYLFGLLSATTTRGEEITRERAKEFYEAQGIAGMLSNQYGEQQRTDYPILKQLPFTNSLYKLGYTYNSEQNTPTITINTYSVTSIDSAISKLKSLATSTEDQITKYDITINEFNNLLENQIQPNESSNPLEYLKSGLKDTDYQVQTGKQENGYYYTNIVTGSEERYTVVTYKAILIQDGNFWRLTSTPYPILTEINTPNVPSSILEAANNFSNN